MVKLKLNNNLGLLNQVKLEVTIMTNLSIVQYQEQKSEKNFGLGMTQLLSSSVITIDN